MPTDLAEWWVPIAARHQSHAPALGRLALHALRHPACREHVVSQEGAFINLTADDDLLPDMAPAALRLLSALPRARPAADGQPAAEWTTLLERANEEFTVPTQASGQRWRARWAGMRGRHMVHACTR